MLEPPSPELPRPLLHHCRLPVHGPDRPVIRRTFTGLPRGTPLALTYDDGPNDPHTLRLLETLARHNVQATFFLIGRYVQQRPDIVRALVNAGHVSEITPSRILC